MIPEGTLCECEDRDGGRHYRIMGGDGSPVVDADGCMTWSRLTPVTVLRWQWIKAGRQPADDGCYLVLCQWPLVALALRLEMVYWIGGRWDFHAPDRIVAFAEIDWLPEREALRGSGRLGAAGAEELSV